MHTLRNLETLERHTYASRHDDGLLDLAAGLGLAWTGLAWLTDLAWAGAVAPALLVPLWVLMRRSITAPRAGTVRFRSERRSLEQRKLVVILLLGIATLVASVALFVTLRADVPADWARHYVAGLPALLLAAGAVLVAMLFGLRRFLIYAMVLVVAAGAAVEQSLEPGLYMAEVGAFVTVVGSAMLLFFLRRNPRPELEGHQ